MMPTCGEAFVTNLLPESIIVTLLQNRCPRVPKASGEREDQAAQQSIVRLLNLPEHNSA